MPVTTEPASHGGSVLVHHEVELHVAAPCAEVRAGLSTLEGLLAHYDTTPPILRERCGTRAAVTGTLRIGGLWMSVVGLAQVVERTDESVSVRIATPAISGVYRVRVRFVPARGSGTVLQVWASFSCRHPELIAMRDQVQERMREHVHYLADRMAVQLAAGGPPAIHVPAQRGTGTPQRSRRRWPAG